MELCVGSSVMRTGFAIPSPLVEVPELACKKQEVRKKVNGNTFPYSAVRYLRRRARSIVCNFSDVCPCKLCHALVEVLRA